MTLLFSLLLSAVSAADISTLFGNPPAPTEQVTVTGTVLSVISPQHIIVRDASGAIFAKTSIDAHCTEGDRVALSGTIQHFNPGLPWFEARRIDVVGHEDPPKPVLADIAGIARGDYNFQPIIFTGVPTDVMVDDVDLDWCWILVESLGAKVAVACPLPKNGIDSIKKIIDAEISITGVPSPDTGYRRFLSSRICIPSTDAIRISKPAPTDPFSVESFTYSSQDLLKPIPRYGHRRKITGILIASWRRRYLFVSPGLDCTMLVDLGHESELPPPGTFVTATGFIHVNAFHARMDNALIKVTSPPQTSIPIRPPRDLPKGLISIGKVRTPGGQKPDINPYCHGSLVRTRGIVKSISNLGTSAAVLYLDCEGSTLPVELGDINPPEAGAFIEITGACILSTENETGGSLFTKLSGASIVPRFPSDIRVLAAPPWWTPAKLSTLVGALLVVLVGLVWRNRQKERQTQRESQLRIDERTKLAVELHDSLAQNLTGISLQLDAAEMAEGEDRTAALTYLSNAREALRSCREGLRYCLSDLRSRSFEDTDMTEAVTETVRPHIGKTKLFVRFNVPRSRLSDSSAHAVLCIVRELAVNAVRHGRATEIHIAGEFRDGQIRFSVRDNGCGFDPDSRPGSAQGHFGLLGVNERIGAFKGALKIDSTIGKGTKATVILNIS